MEAYYWLHILTIMARGLTPIFHTCFAADAALGNLSYLRGARARRLLIRSTQ